MEFCLHRSVYQLWTKDLDFVKWLVAKGANIESRSRLDQKTPLAEASSIPDINIMNFLLQKGADIEAKDENCKTPLIIAATSLFIEDETRHATCKFLIEARANVNVVEHPFHSLVQSGLSRKEVGYHKLVDLFLKNGVNIDLDFATGFIHRCIAYMEFQLLSVFIKQGGIGPTLKNINVHDMQVVTADSSTKYFLNFVTFSHLCTWHFCAGM